MLLLWRQITVDSTCPPWAVMLGWVCVCVWDGDPQCVSSVHVFLCLHYYATMFVNVCVCAFVHASCTHLQVCLWFRLPAEWCVLVLIICIWMYIHCVCVSVCVLLISKTAPEAPDGWPSIRLSVSQERIPQPGGNMMLWPWGVEGLEVWILLHCFTLPLLSRKKIWENPLADILIELH